MAFGSAMAAPVREPIGGWGSPRRSKRSWMRRSGAIAGSAAVDITCHLLKAASTVSGLSFPPDQDESCMRHEGSRRPAGTASILLLCARIEEDLVSGCSLASEPGDGNARERACRAVRAIAGSRNEFGALLYLFGLCGTPSKTAEDVAAMYDLPPGRVAEIEAEAVTRLRSNARCGDLLRPIVDAMVRSVQRLGGIASVQEVVEETFSNEEHLHLMSPARPLLRASHNLMSSQRWVSGTSVERLSVARPTSLLRGLLGG